MIAAIPTCLVCSRSESFPSMDVQLQKMRGFDLEQTGATNKGRLERFPGLRLSSYGWGASAVRPNPSKSHPMTGGSGAWFSLDPRSRATCCARPLTN